MAEAAKPGRRTLVGSLGWVMGIGGLGVAGITLFRSAAPAGYDPRIRIELPEKPDEYRRTVTIQGQPVAILGLNREEAAKYAPSPGAPPFVIVVQHCTRDGCVVFAQAETMGLPDPSLRHWTCPCCGARYSLTGQPIAYPAKQALFIPPYQFVGRRNVLIGPPFRAT